MSANPLTPQQIADLKKAQEDLTKLDGAISKMKLAQIPVDESTEIAHKELKKRVAALLSVYGNK